MSISGISSNTSFLQQSNTNSPQQWQRVLQGREDFTLLAEALQSGDLAAARQAYADLQTLQQSSISSGTLLQGDFAALGRALASSNLSQAQSDLTQLQSDVKSMLRNQPGLPGPGGARGHQRHHHPVESNPDSSNTTNPTSQTGTSVNVTA